MPPAARSILPSAHLGGLAAEPSIRDVQDAVRLVHKDPYAGIGSASRWAHVLPTKVSVRVQRDDANDWTGTLTDDSGWTHKSSGDARLVWRIEAEWDLSRLAHDPAALALATRRAAERRRASEAVDRATRIYFDRRQLQLELLGSEGSLAHERRTALWVRIAELTARLDAMTGGLFARTGVQWWGPSAPDSSARSGLGTLREPPPPAAHGP